MSSMHLACQSGPLRGTNLDLPTKRASVGRDPSCDIKIDDPKISRIHGYLEMRGDALWFTDNRSTNGSYLNGEKVSESQLRLGDSLQLGNSEFVLLEASDFRTINFVSSQTMVTGSFSTGMASSDALAAKFNQIFEFYRAGGQDQQEPSNVDILQTQRMLNSLKTLYAVGQRMARLEAMSELVKDVASSLFEVFGGAENVVILMKDDETEELRPVHAARRGSDTVPKVSISQTVLDQAVREKATLLANDAGQDDRISASDSIAGLQVKSVLCAPLVVADNVLGALYIDNREVTVRYDEMDAELVSAFANQAAIAINNVKLMESLQTSYHQTLQALVNAIEAKDPYTMGHTARVSKIAVGIAREYGLNPKRIERLKMAADLHDIGKIGVKEGIINKPGKLTDEEYEDIKTHVEMGEMILKPIMYLKDILPFIRGHHEKWDGTGYPDGLKGEECPLEGRIIALADVFDAMTSQRPYNKPLSYTAGVERIKESSGKHFDPGVVDAFVRMMERLSSTREGGRVSGMFELSMPTPNGPLTHGGTTPKMDESAIVSSDEIAPHTALMTPVAPMTAIEEREPTK